MSRAAVIFKCLVVTLVVSLPLAMVPAASWAASGGSSGAGSSSTTCTAPVVSEVYSWAQDTNLYAPLPGERWDSMGNGAGWTLSGGAKFETVTLMDGKKGSVLDLPSGSEAITPAVCVTNDYPFARTETRDVTGSAGVNIYVSYPDGGSANSNLFSANVAGSGLLWTVSKPFNIIRSNVSGWQLAQFTLVPQGQSSEYQISNFYVDPRMHH